MTPAQLATLKADIAADPTFSALPNNDDTAFYIASQYNIAAAPTFTVWKTSVPISQVGDAMDSTEVAGLTSGNVQRLQVIAQYSGGTVNPSLADRRAGFDDIFSGAGGAITRPKLLALWKRVATRAEKLFATGTGSDAVPAQLTFEGSISGNDVRQARNI
jgi:hypothetical protein